MIQKIVKTCLQVCYQLLIVYEVLIRPKLENFWKIVPNYFNFEEASKAKEVDFAKLQKLPVHLAISIGHYTMDIFNENGNVNLSVYLEKIAEMVCWASRLNIKILSFYDPEGVLKSHSKILCQHLNQKFLQCSSENVSHIVCTKNTSLQENNFVDDQITVFIRCRQDGKKLLLQVMKEIYLNKKLKPNPSTPLTNEIFDDHLNTMMYSKLWVDIDKRSTLKTEPDLLMITEKTKSLLGFLPWHIRNTEIHVLPNLLDLDYTKFEMSIRNFANCEQRFGK